MLLPCDNILLRIQLVPNIFTVLEGLKIFLVRICLVSLILVDRVGDCRLTLDCFFHTILITFSGYVLRRDGRRGHDITWVFLAVHIVSFILLNLTVYFNAVSWPYQVLSLDALVWSNADDSTTCRKIILWPVRIASVRSDVR